MTRIINLVLLSVAALLFNPAAFTVEGQILRASAVAQNSEVKNDAVERELQRRRGMGGKGGKGKGGKGKGGSSRSGGNIRFLPPRIDPIPGVNCRPLPPGFGRSGGSKGGKGGKGGKGKGNRQRNRRSNSRARQLRSGSKGGKGRLGGRNRNGGGMNMMGGRDLPFCPADQPTFFPTALPSFTPFPTSTPLPTVTPFPSVTPFPTTDAEGPPNAPPTTAAPGPATTLAPSNPGDTIAPTTPGGGAPVSTPAGTTRVLVESQLEYGFFPEVTPRQPTEEEYNGLMVETTRFYEEALRAAFPNLASFEAVRVADEFRPGNTDRPVKIDFDANAFFTTGTTAPTPAEVFAVMEDLDYMNYITSFVWNALPTDGVFSDTQRAAYAARVLA